MTHPLVDQFRFTRIEWLRGLSGVTEEELVGQTSGDAMRPITYRYWFHLGEVLAIRQIIGGKDLPEYVGDIEGEAPYRPE